MVDIETLGTRPGSVILSVGACAFSSEGIGATFYRAIDLFDSLVTRGLSIDPQTVAWWRTQPDEARHAAAPIEGTTSLHNALHAFATFVTDADAPYLWAKGPDFDLVLLAEAYHACGLPVPWSFRHTRDVRTIAALVRDRLPVAANTKKHHALHDAIHQANVVLACYATLGLDIDAPPEPRA